MSDIKACRDTLALILKEHTPLQDEELRQIVDDIPIKEYIKGTTLLQQGFQPKCFNYFIIKGCVRQYTSDENGKEVTVNFYTEQEPINIATFLDNCGVSLYSLACLEDCMTVECDEKINEDDEDFVISMEHFLEKQFSDMQINYTGFKLKTPEERFRMLVDQRPDLLSRVPQIHLASYLGITPETYSRFKKKIKV